MKYWIIGIGIGLAALVVVAVGILVAGFFWTGRAMMPFGWLNTSMMGRYIGSPDFNGTNDGRIGSTPTDCSQNQTSGSIFSRMMGGRTNGGMMRRGFGGMMGGNGGMMGGYSRFTYQGSAGSCTYNNGTGEANGARLAIEEVQTALEGYLSDRPGLKLAEIMEFEDNFYGVVIEKETGKGAMELLVDPYTGQVYPEHGPNMMWNEKYGHMGSWYSTSGKKLTLENASDLAQSALEEQVPDAELEGMGIEFYGYHTFDYAIDGKIAGMLSVSSDGQTWLHTWHGAFIQEIELDE